MRKCEQATYNTLLKQINDKTFRDKNHVYSQVKTFLNETKIVQVPDLSFDQIDELLQHKSTQKVFLEFKQMIVQLKQYFINNNIIDSTFEIMVNGEVKQLQRMCKKTFETLLSTLQTPKKDIKNFIENLNEETEISVDQLKMLLAQFDYNAKNKKIIQQFLDNMQSRMINKETVEAEVDYQQLINKQKYTYTEINQVQEWLLTVDQIDEFPVYEKPYDKQTLINKYIDIMKQANNLCQYAGLLNEEILTGFTSKLPLIIFKSLQILNNYQNYKVVNSLIFGLMTPICYVSEIDAIGLLIVKNKQDIHLTDEQNKPLHKLLMKQENTKNIIHHINSNEFDNRVQNLVEIVVTDEQKQVFGQEYTNFLKHRYIHDVLNSEYKIYFFTNCLDLKYFEANLTYYKDIISNINDAKKLKYELDSSYVVHPKYDQDKFLEYLLCQLNWALWMQLQIDKIEQLQAWLQMEPTLFFQHIERMRGNGKPIFKPQIKKQNYVQKPVEVMKPVEMKKPKKQQQKPKRLQTMKIVNQNQIIQKKQEQKELKESKEQIFAPDQEELDRIQQKHFDMLQVQKVKEIKQQLAQLSQEQVKEIISQNNNYNRSTDSLYQNEFFKMFAGDIFASKIGMFVEIISVRETEGGLFIQETKIYKIDDGLNKRLIDFCREGYQYNHIDQIASDSIYLYYITQAISIRFFTKEQNKQNKQGDYEAVREKVIDMSASKNWYKKRVGAYFNFLNNNPYIDLSRYQIGHSLSEHDKLSQTNCFIHTLKMSGLYCKEEIEYIESQINGEVNLFSKNSFKKIKGLGRFQLTHIVEGKKPKPLHYDEEGKLLTKVDKEYTGNVLRIVLFQDHYFINEEMDVSLNWIKNYNQYKHEPKFIDRVKDLKCVEMKKDQPYFRPIQNVTHSSQDVIYNMWCFGMFDKIDLLNKFNYDKEVKNEINAPDGIEYYQEAEEEKEEEEDDEKKEFKLLGKFQNVYVMDFEAFTKNDQNISIDHNPYTVHYADFDRQYYHSRNIQGFVTHVVKNEYKSILVYIQNLSYDCTFILNQKNITPLQILDPQGRYVQFTVKIAKCTVTFRDSCRMLPGKLSELPEMFFTVEEQKSIYKELMCYDYYTKTRYILNRGDIDDAMKSFKLHKPTREQFVESLSKADSIIDENTFDMQKFAAYYCKQDCFVLLESLLKFQQMLWNEFQINMVDVVSISSLSLKYQVKHKCFKGCVKVNGCLARYFQQFLRGGRVQVSENKRIMKKNVKIVDFDAVSLYPSAQKRVWYPTGQCQKMSEEMIKYYNNKQNLLNIGVTKEDKDLNTLFVTVKLNSDNIIKRKMMLLSEKRDGIRVWINETDKDKLHYLSHVALQDLITFQNYGYTIIEGVYFTKRDYTINTVIAEMFERRVYYKELKNNVQIIYKLALNSSYGKTCEGLHSTRTVIKDVDTAHDYMLKNYNVFKEAVVIGEKYFITENVEVIKQKSYNYIGVLILDMSKRIMNEVMCLAEDLGIEIYYTDTDSMHIDKDGLDMLEIEFQKKYKRELQGKKQGQFHSDFSSNKGKVLYADQSIFLGKKCYVDRLVVKTKDGEIVNDYHIRMKGINTECIIEKAKQCYNGDVMKLYEDLYNGNKVTFDLCDGKVVFQKTDMQYTTLEKFERVLHFPVDYCENEDEEELITEEDEKLTNNDKE